MKEQQLVKGNTALAEASIKAKCLYYFGYPITPQNDIPEYLAEHLPEWGGTFVQAESEVASINMVMGASASGVRVMTSSSGPGISLMQEGMSYMAGSEIPGVVVNIMRCGPGLGGISPTQGDYFQATRGGGHGDYYNIVLAPASVQEMFDLTVKAFELSDKYRNPAMILADAILGQMKQSPGNIRFRDLSKVCDHFFGTPRQSGTSHRVYKMPWQGDPRINIQNAKGMAKAYQVKQVLLAVSRLEEEDASS